MLNTLAAICSILGFILAVVGYLGRRKVIGSHHAAPRPMIAETQHPVPADDGNLSERRSRGAPYVVGLVVGLLLLVLAGLSVLIGPIQRAQVMSKLTESVEGIRTNRASVVRGALQVLAESSPQDHDMVIRNLAAVNFEYASPMLSCVDGQVVWISPALLIEARWVRRPKDSYNAVAAVLAFYARLSSTTEPKSEVARGEAAFASAQSLLRKLHCPPQVESAIAGAYYGKCGKWPSGWSQERVM